MGSIPGSGRSLEEMATYFSIMASKIPWTEEPEGLQSMESKRVGHHLVTKQQQTMEELETKEMIAVQLFTDPMVYSLPSSSVI